MTDTELIDGLRKLCGYVENGSDTTVRIFQDDATRSWIVKFGEDWGSGNTIRQALEDAIRRDGL